MPYHRLDAARDADFLAERLADPFTGAPFEAGNYVVRAFDGTTLLRETWEALGRDYRGHTETLPWDGARAEPPISVQGDDAPPPAPTAPATAPVAWTAREPRPAVRQEVTSRDSRGRAWLWIPLGVAGLVVAGVLLSGLFRDSAERPAATPIAQTSDTGETAKAVQIRAGTVDGSLSDNDFQTSEGYYQDAYEFEADSSGRVVFVRLETRDFAPDIFVDTEAGRRIAGRRVSTNDGHNAVEVSDLRGPGTFRIVITSRRPNEQGAYSLVVHQRRPVRTLRADGRPVTVTLGEFSERVNGAFRDVWEIRTKENFEHTLTVSSTAFTPRVVILAPDGSAVFPDVDGEAGGPTYTFTSSSDGIYRILVTSGGDAARGRYAIRLEAQEADDEPLETTIQANAGNTQMTLLQGQTHTHTFSGAVGDRVSVVVRSADFPPALSLSGPGDYRLSGNEPNAEQASLQFTIPASGVYSLAVRSRNADQGGAYSLSLDTTEAPSGQDIPRLPGFDMPEPEPTPDETETEPEAGIEGEVPQEPDAEPGNAQEGEEEYQPQRIGWD